MANFLSKIIFNRLVKLFKKYGVMFDDSYWQVEPVFVAAAPRYVSLIELRAVVSEKNRVVAQNSLEFLRFPFLVKDRTSKFLPSKLFIHESNIVKQYLRYVPEDPYTAHDIRAYYGFIKEPGFRGFGEEKKTFLFHFNLMLKHLEVAGENPSLALLFLVCEAAFRFSLFKSSVQKSGEDRAQEVKTLWSRDSLLSVLTEQSALRKKKAYIKILTSVGQRTVLTANSFSAILADLFVGYYGAVMADFKSKSLNSLLESEILQVSYHMSLSRMLLAVQLEAVLSASDLIDLSSPLEHEGRGYTVVLNSVFLKVNNFYSSHIPMVAKPQDWVAVKAKSKNSGSLYDDAQGGGYLNNHLGFFKIVRTRSFSETYLNLPDQESRNLNYLQSVPFQVNSRALSFLKSNFHASFSNYCLYRKVTLLDFLKTQVGSVMTFYTFLEYLTKKNIANFDQSYFEAALMDYNRFQTVLLDYIFLLEFAETLLYYNAGRLDFYFTTFLDFRGRVYYGNIFSPQGCALTKLLLKLSNNSSAVMDVDFDLKNICISKTGKKYFESLRGVLNPWDAFYDASCSGVSIIGGLIGSIECMLLTNVVVRASSLGFIEKKDFYAGIVEKINADFLEIYLQDLTCLKGHSSSLYLGYQKSKMKSCVVEEDEAFHSKTPSFDLGLDLVPHIVVKLCYLILQKVLTREFIKGWTMRYIYSEGVQSRMDNLLPEYVKYRSNFLESLKLDVHPDLPENITEFERYVLFKFCVGFPSFIDPKVEEFITFLQKLFLKSLKAPNLILCTSTSTSNTVTPKPHGIFSFWDLRKREENHLTVSYVGENGQLARSTRQYFESQGTLDKSKVRRSLIANFIQHLDSCLLNSVVKDLAALKVPCAVVHDCFMVPVNHKETLQQVYFEAYKRILLEGDVVEAFLEANGITLDLAAKNVLKGYKKNRSAILKDLSNKSLLRSNFILS